MSAESANAGSPVRLFMSERGRLEGMDPAPLLVYGHEAERLAGLVARYSTLSSVSIQGLANLSALLRHLPRAVGMVATSRPGRPGEAHEALELLRQALPRRSVAIYGAWDFSVERAARRALECRADGVLMPGMDLAELFDYLLAALSGAPVPSTVEEHEARLREHAPRSSFWRLGSRAPSDMF